MKCGYRSLFFIMKTEHIVSSKCSCIYIDSKPRVVSMWHVNYHCDIFVDVSGNKRQIQSAEGWTESHHESWRCHTNCQKVETVSVLTNPFVMYIMYSVNNPCILVTQYRNYSNDLGHYCAFPNEFELNKENYHCCLMTSIMHCCLENTIFHLIVSFVDRKNVKKYTWKMYTLCSWHMSF